MGMTYWGSVGQALVHSGLPRAVGVSPVTIRHDDFLKDCMAPMIFESVNIHGPRFTGQDVLMSLLEVIHIRVTAPIGSSMVHS